MFGAKTPFGATSTFGTGTTFGAQASSSPFGQTAATSTGGGLFGSTSTQPAFGGFGTSQQPNTGLFGSSTNTGTTGLFGSGTSSGSLFGQPASSSGGIFGGNAASANLFGQSSSFGSGSTGFGTSGKLFGTPSTSTSTGLFGSGTTGTQSSLFGGNSSFQSTGFGAAQATTQAGTPVKFNVVNGTDQMVKNGISTTVNTRHQSITVMKEYEAKSFEELRCEDYTLGRKTGPSTSGGLFSGTTATTTSSSTGGLFGSNTSSFSPFPQTKTGFGTAGGSLFGQTNQQSGGLFGSKPGGLFGTSTATTSTPAFGSTFGSTQASGGLFGQSSNTGQTGGLFGATTTTQSGGIFGSANTGFGQSTTGTGVFGQTGFGNAQQQSGLFNNKLGTGSTFGSSTSGSLFGNQNKPTTSVFGGLGAGTGFGSAANSSLFGKPAFGTTNALNTGFGTAGSSLFGSGTNTGLNTGGNILGSGLGTQTGFGTAFAPTGTALNLGANTLLGSQNNSLGLAQQQQQQQLLLHQQILALNNSPFGDSKLFRNSLNDKTSKALTTTTASSQHVLGSPSHYKVSSKLTAKIKPRPINYHTMNKSKLFEGLDDETGLSPDTFVPRKSVKKLIIKSKTAEEKNVITPNSEIKSQEQRSTASPILNGSDTANTTSPMGVRFSTGTRRTNAIASEQREHITDYKYEENVDEPKDDHNADESVRLEPCGIILTRPEYYMVPPMNELNDMIDSNGEVWVNDFVVGREGYGEVKFLGRTNVADLNLDDIVFFRRREIEVYPESFPNKPPVGERLNKKAEITLLNVWPNDKTTHTPIKTPERLRLQGWLEKVEAATAKLDATFLDYRPETGTWVFVVEHFTKYGIHEFLEAENLTKKQKKVTIDLDKRLEKEECHKDVIIDDEEKMLISKSIDEQHQAKIAAFEQEKESALTESMQDQDSDIDDLELQTFPDDVLDNDEEQFGELPASHQLAAVLGVSAHRMQVMKASFFGESQHAQPVSKPLLSDTRPSSQHTAPLSHGHEVALFGSPRKDVIAKSANLPYTVTSDSPSSKLMDPSAIGSALDRGTKLVGARAKQRQLVPKEKSITNRKEHFISDLGLVMGRSFRVGWGPGFTFVHCGHPKGEKTGKTSTIVMSSVTQDVLMPKSRHVQEAEAGLTPFGLFKERINIASHLTQDNEKGLMQHIMGLEVELDHSKSTMQNGCPLFEPSPGTEGIHHHAEMCRKNIDAFISDPLQDTAKHMSLVWDLVVALWGQQEEKDIDSYSNHILRRQALCSWFANACKEKVKAEVDQYGNFEESDYLKAIWSHLTGGQISQACNLAIKHSDYRLAMLLSQATGHISSRQLIQQQLHDWEVLKADNYISDQRLKIIALLAGTLVWRTSTNTLNTCHELDWKRTFAVHMLYQSSPSSSIAEILSNYEDSYQGTSSYESYGAPPLPSYMEENHDFDYVQDTCYHLIKLYCERSHSLEKALAPSTYTPFQLDYRQSWHLSLAMLSLGYTHMSSYHTGLLHTSFAAQLEALGLWQWSAFVLLHLKDYAKRECAVRSLLYRHCELSTSAEYIRKEEFLQGKLHIPPEWIHEAKAIRAMYLSQADKQAFHLLKSQQWNHCHEVVLNSLASVAIINEEYDDVHSILTELEPRERCSTIKNWSTGGQVILHFLKVDKNIKGLTEGSVEPTKYKFEELHMHLSSLCNRISNLPSTTVYDRLCQYELAQKCSNYLKLVTLELDDLSEDTWFTTRDVVPHISQLPLPEDYRLAELQGLTAHYVSEI